MLKLGQDVVFRNGLLAGQVAKIVSIGSQVDILGETHTEIVVAITHDHALPAPFKPRNIHLVSSQVIPL